MFKLRKKFSGKQSLIFREKLEYFTKLLEIIDEILEHYQSPAAKYSIQVILAGTLTGVQGDIRCKVIEGLIEGLTEESVFIH